MNQGTIERSIIVALIILTATLGFFATRLNQGSFKEVARIIYGVKTEVGNLRIKSSTNSKIVTKMQSGDLLRVIAKRPGGWYKVKHLPSLMEGYAHKSIMSKYVYLGYYDDYVIDKSLLEIEWH
jgi:hypothetical protein